MDRRMRPIIVCSMPGNGNHFAMDLFHKHRRTHITTLADGCRTMVHLTEPEVALVHDHQTALIVTPILSRSAPFPIPEGAFVLHVDARNESELESLSKLVGYAITTDWKPVNRSVGRS